MSTGEYGDNVAEQESRKMEIKSGFEKTLGEYNKISIVDTEKKELANLLESIRISTKNLRALEELV